MDGFFEVLSNHRRLFVLIYLSKCGELANITEVSKSIAAMENEKPSEDLTEQQTKRVYVSLHQNHLPTLEEADLVEYAPDGRQIHLTETGREVVRYLVVTRKPTYPWPFHYLVLSVLSVALLALSVADAPLVNTIPVVWIASISLTGFLVSTVVYFQIHQERSLSPSASNIEG